MKIFLTAAGWWKLIWAHFTRAFQMRASKVKFKLSLLNLGFWTSPFNMVNFLNDTLLQMWNLCLDSVQEDIWFFMQPLMHYCLSIFVRMEILIKYCLLINWNIQIEQWYWNCSPVALPGSTVTSCKDPRFNQRKCVVFFYVAHFCPKCGPNFKKFGDHWVTSD